MDVTLFPLRDTRLNLSAHRFSFTREQEAPRPVQYLAKDLAQGIALDFNITNPSRYLAQELPYNLEKPLSDAPIATAVLDTFIELTKRGVTLKSLIAFHDELSKTRSDILEKRENDPLKVLKYIGDRYAYSLVCQLGSTLCSQLSHGEVPSHFDRDTEILTLRRNEYSPFALQFLPPFSNSLFDKLPLFLGERLSEFALNATLCEAHSAFESLQHSAERGNTLITDRYRELYEKR